MVTAQVLWSLPAAVLPGTVTGSRTFHRRLVDGSAGSGLRRTVLRPAMVDTSGGGLRIVSNCSRKDPAKVGLLSHWIGRSALQYSPLQDLVVDVRPQEYLHRVRFLIARVSEGDSGQGAPTPGCRCDSSGNIKASARCCWLREWVEDNSSVVRPLVKRERAPPTSSRGILPLWRGNARRCTNDSETRDTSLPGSRGLVPSRPLHQDSRLSPSPCSG